MSTKTVEKTDKSVKYTPNQAYNVLKDIIAANDVLISRNQMPVSISVIGVHGIGKTTVVRELAQDLGRDFFKLNLSQITEPSELIGFYAKEFEMVKDKDIVWVTEAMIPKFHEDGYKSSGRTKTSPCPPDWVVNLKENGILFLDDFSRGNTLLMQSVMEICNEGTMIGWDLSAKKIQVILSENPDDGEYNVSSVDAAHTSRMLKIHMKWDAKDWAERAEKIKMDPRLINFVLWKPELLDNKKEEGISASGNVSPRMMDKFFSLVSTIDDFEKHLDKISLYGSISVGSQITGEFLNFINKKLDKLPNIEDLIFNFDEKAAKKALTDCCGDHEKNSNGWKGATAAILATRMYNYVRFYNKDFKKDDIKRYGELLLHSAFSQDHKYMMVKQVVNCGNQFASILVGDPRFINYMKQ